MWHLVVALADLVADGHATDVTHIWSTEMTSAKQNRYFKAVVSNLVAIHHMWRKAVKMWRIYLTVGQRWFTAKNTFFIKLCQTKLDKGSFEK
jgi:hypothetical protein